MPMITIRDTAASAADAVRPAYLAEPVAVSDRPGPWPGVVVMHDAFGLGDDMKEQADWLAASGYLAVVPDLYNGRSMVRCIKASFSQLTAQHGPVFDQIESARGHLAERSNCTGYDHDSAADAKERILTFFDQHLRVSATAPAESLG